MKRVLVWFGTVAVLAALLVSPVIAKTDKVTICHAAGLDGTTKYVRIVVSSHAIGGHFYNNGTPKAGHEDDILLQGEQRCPSNSSTPVPTPSVSASTSPSQNGSPTPTPVTSPTLTPSESPSPSVKVSDTPIPTPVTSDLPNTAMSGILR